MGVGNSLIEQIPDKNKIGTDMYITTDISVFRPSEYVTNVEVNLTEYHFTFPVSALPTIRVGKRDYDISKGKMLAFAPYTTMMCTKEVPTSRYTAVSVSREFFKSTAKEALNNKVEDFSETGYLFDRRILNIIRAFEEEVECFQNSCPLMLQSIGAQIVVQLLRCMGKEMDTNRQSADRNYIDIAKEYMMAYYNANIKIEDVCKLINISPYHFIRMFRDKTGITPHAFLQSVRIEKAEEMLKKGRHSVEEVAMFCGYIDTSHFSNYFKRIKGMSPSAYIK